MSTTGVLSNFAGGLCGYSNGIGGLFGGISGIAFDSTTRFLYLADYSNYRIRVLDTLSKSISDLAGNGIAGSQDGMGTAATFDFFNTMSNLAVDPVTSNVILADVHNCRVRQIQPSGLVTTIAGRVCGYANGFGTSAQFSGTGSVAVANGNIYVGDSSYLRLLTCVPCPGSFYCYSGGPIICPSGSYCPMSSINPTPCPAGKFSAVTGAATDATCTPCAAGTFTAATGSASCQQCAGGHFCPAGTSSWARLNCGKGNFCPDGSGAPTPCPYQVPPTGGWGALQVQGPAFLVETARCLNHCFWNFTSGDGMLSKC